MKRSELIDALVAKHGITRAQANAALKAMTERITRGLEDGDRVRLSGFGSFFCKDYPGYVGRNPRTGVHVDVAPKRGLRFKAHRSMEKRLNKAHGP